MSHIYSLQIEALAKIKNLRKLINLFKADIAARVLDKQKKINIQICKDLKDQCETILIAINPKKFQCKYCEKRFDDGRQLGGHTSRVHKQEYKLRGMKTDSINQILEQDMHELKIQEDDNQYFKLKANKRKTKYIESQNIKMEEKNTLKMIDLASFKK